MAQHMYIIGHRGAAAQKPENTLASIRAAGASVHMLEIDVRQTADGVLVLSHDQSLNRTHGIELDISRSNLRTIQRRTAGSKNPICTLEEALREVLPKMVVFINITSKNTGIKTLELLRTNKLKPYADNVVLSSRSIRELIRIRNINKKVKLALLQRMNPYMFLAWEKRLGLTAVGFHRLHMPRVAIDLARKLDIFTYVYTVNRSNSLKQLSKSKIDAVVTDYPERFAREAQQLDI